MRKKPTFSDIIPKTKNVKLSDIDRFVEGMKILAKECNVTGYSAIDLTFKDGSRGGFKIIMHKALGWGI